MDLRINPQQYGPQQQQGFDPTMSVPGVVPQPPMRLDVGPSIREELDNTSPEMLNLANYVGSELKRRGHGDFVMQAAFRRQTPQDLTDYVAAEEKTRAALQLAQESMELSDKQFEQLLAELEAETGQSQELPEQTQPQMPNDRQIILSALLSMGAGKNRFNTLAAPFQYALHEASIEDQRKMQKFQLQRQAREEKLGLIKTKLEMAYRSKENAAKMYFDLAQQAEEAGKGREATALKWLGEFTKAESEDAVDFAVDTIRQYSPQLAPTPSQISARKAHIRRIAAAKAEEDKLAADKTEDERINREVDNFRGFYPPLMDRDQALSDQINAEARQFERDRNLPPGSIQTYYPYTTPAAGGLDLRQTQWDDGAAMRDLEYRGQELLNRGRELENAAKAAKPTPEKAAKQKRIANLDDDIRKKRSAVDLALRTMPVPPGKNDDDEAWKKWSEDTYRAIQEEYQAFLDKRTETGGDKPSIKDYILSQGERMQVIAKAFGWAAPTAPLMPRMTAPGTQLTRTTDASPPVKAARDRMKAAGTLPKGWKLK